MTDRVTRRHFVKTASTSAALIATGAGLTAQGDDSSSEQGGGFTAAQSVPQAELVPGMTIGRMLLGGNLLTHYTHSRDLRYVYTLAARYNTKDKIFETMATAEAHGINAVVIHTAAGVVDWLQEYRNRGGKMKWIICPTAEVTDDMKAYRESCKMLRDIGTDSIYLWGVRGDQFGGVDLQGRRSTPRPDLMAKAVEAAKDVGLPAGVGAHRLETIQCCEENDIPADYYVKTLHSADYPSVDIDHDNRWSFTPEDTIEFMKDVQKPWIAFKVMAAGALSPRNGFTHAFQNGADFSLAGMFDYEIAENVATMNEVLALASVTNRPRPWIA